MFDHFRQRFGNEQKPKRETPELVELRPEDVTSLNLGWSSHFNTASLRQHLFDYPGLSLRVRGQEEYVVGDRWRRHDGVGQILESKGRLYRPELVDGLVAEFERRGFGAIVISHDEHSDNFRLYAEAGFEEIERIVYYEKPDVQLNFAYEGTPLQFTPYNPGLLDDLLTVDHASFPWLWWNSRREVEYYSSQDDVSIFIAYAENGTRPVGYFSFTLYERWAHLDRLAVIPEMQGQKVGAYQLGVGINIMAERGARRVTLSTQLNNKQSQRLYEGFGFQRVRSLEYSLIGRWLGK